jgi:prophage DNA circulation protein
MANIVLTLGDVVFSGLEIPENISFGGRQQLAVKRLVGGTKVIDSMGADEAPKSWSGLFLGSTALARAQSLDQWRKDGQSVVLTWDTLRYLVVVSDFDASYEAPFRIPYRITCEVSEDQTSPGGTGAFDLDSVIRGDMTSATGLAGSIGDGTLSSLTSTLSTAVSTVSDFAKAAQSTIQTVVAPLNAARQQVQTLIASSENTLKNIVTVGGILPNNPLATNVSRLTTQLNTNLSTTFLYKYDSSLARMATNLGQVNSSVKTVTVAGGNLFDIASKYYKDATSWTSIAKANNITDPELTGITTLVIPANNNPVGGVLTQ